MKYQTDKQFEFIDLHDSLIEKIEFKPDEITIRLSFANLYPEHESNTNDMAKCIKPCILKFKGVTDSRASVFKEDKRIFEPHPEPMEPIEGAIMEAQEMPGKGFCLKGFHRLGWSEWFIFCSEFNLSWSTFSGDAWFVNWPPK